MRYKTAKSNQKQKGFVSIIVTMIIMIVISLIVIGFARLVQRDQRQSLDKQLSTQAFYAAETGVNDAVRTIKNLLAANSSIPNKASCGPDAVFTASNVIDASSGTSYSCLLVDPAPSSLEYSDVDVNQSQIIPIILQDQTTALNSLTISWQAKDGTTGFSCPGGGRTYPALPPAGSWGCPTGVMRIDLVPFNVPKTRAQLSSETFNAFLYPQTSGVTSADYSGSQGNMYGVQCSDATTPRYCSFTIKLLNANRLYLRVKSIYAASSLTITGTTVSGAQPEFLGTQVLVDSTGKATDVLKRIQVRVPVMQEGLWPDSPLNTNSSICKRYKVIAGVSLELDAADGNITDASNACSIF